MKKTNFDFESHSKINLGLKVLNQRIDGYHNINSIFIPPGPGDESLSIGACYVMLEQFKFPKSKISKLNKVDSKLFKFWKRRFWLNLCSFKFNCDKQINQSSKFN